MYTRIASQNGEKIAAVREKGRQIFPGIPHVFRGDKADHGLDAQLEGEQVILDGGLLRLQNLKQISEETVADLLIAIQEGIFSRKIAKTPHWFTYAWIIAEDAEGNQGISSSASMEIPAEIVEEARLIIPQKNRFGFQNTTIGDIIAKQAAAKANLTGKIISRTDPQILLSNMIIGRTSILGQATEAAIGQLLTKSTSLAPFRVNAKK